MNPLISIIVPVYNVKNYLPSCVESILNQTYSDFELILIDDGSDDGSEKICDDLLKKDNRIVVIHKKNGGVSSARNAGLKVSKGEYISFVDSDDTIDPLYFEELLHLLKNSKYDFVACSLLATDGKCTYMLDGQSNNSGQIKDVKLNSDSFEFFRWYSINGPFCKLIKKDLLTLEGELFFDESLSVGEDLVFYIEVLKRARGCTALAKTLYYYLQRSDSAMNTKSLKNRLSEIRAWEIACAMINKEFAAFDDASRKLLYYTFLTLKTCDTEKLKFKQKIHLRIILIKKQKYKSVIGSNWKTRILYYLLIINPHLYFLMTK